jgi:hypothetical protein
MRVASPPSRRCSMGAWTAMIPTVIAIALLVATLRLDRYAK